MVAFVVRLSNLLFRNLEYIFYSNPFILKNYSLIVTIIVYHVPSIEVSVFIWLITALSQHEGCDGGRFTTGSDVVYIYIYI